MKRKRTTINISLSAQLIEIVEEGINAGFYNSTSEFFRFLIRKWKQDQMSSKTQNKERN